MDLMSPPRQYGGKDGLSYMRVSAQNLEFMMRSLVLPSSARREDGP